MLNLPQTTQFNRRVPKQRFCDVTAAETLKNAFKDVKTIYWRNKIAASTTNLAAGSRVTEIEVFEVKFNSKNLIEQVLRCIDRQIPYHILFLVECGGEYQLWICYKEVSLTGAVKVDKYFYTDWLSKEDVAIKIEGLDLDSVYENFVRQVAAEKLISCGGEPLQKAVARSQNCEKLKKQIAALEAKILKENQFNKQVALNAQIKELKNQLQQMKEGK